MALLSCFSLAACSQGTQKPEGTIVCFDYNFNGTIGGWYKFNVQKEIIKMAFMDYSMVGSHEYEYKADSTFLAQLTELCNKYKVYHWDGFDKTNPDIFDGEGFSLYIKYGNGKQVSARGMNCFPKDYRLFRTELYTLFESFYNTQNPNQDKNDLSTE